MVARVITTALCDICLRALQVEREATFRGPVGLGAVRRSLELCFDHEQELVEPLRSAMNTYGGPVDSRVERLLDDGLCPVCRRSFRTRKALVRHVEQNHEAPAGAAS